MTTVPLAFADPCPAPPGRPTARAAGPVPPPDPGVLAGRLIRLAGRAAPARVAPPVTARAGDAPGGCDGAGPHDDLFLRDFFRSPLLPRADTDDLLRQLAALGPLADGPDGRYRAVPPAHRSRFVALRNRVVMGHLRLAADAVRGRPGRCAALTEADLFQEAVFGLMRAVELFDPDREVAFATYAYHWLRQAVGRAVLHTDRMIRLPAYCLSGPDRLPAADLARFRRVLPLDGFAAGLIDPRVPDPADETADRDARAALPGVVAAALRTLAGRDADILRRRFGVPDGREETLQELGEWYGLTRERVRQIAARALEHLRHPRRLAALEAVAPAERRPTPRRVHGFRRTSPAALRTDNGNTA